MARLRILILILICSVSASAQMSKAAEWSAQAYVDYGFIEPNVVYGRAGDVELKLDVYKPKAKSAKPRPVLIFFHGGGWRGGSKESYSLRVLPWLEMGWAVVNVEYRVTGIARAPAAVEDARCAVRFVTENAGKYGIDKSQIVVSGQSAGGHLALMAGLAAKEKAFDTNCPGEETRVAAVVNWFGITDVGDLLQGKNNTEFASNWIGKDRLENAELIRLVSPLTYVSADNPPVISIHGDADPLVPYTHAVRLHDALAKAKVANELFTVKKGDHGDFSRAESIKAYAAIRKFLKKNGIGK